MKNKKSLIIIYLLTGTFFVLILVGALCYVSLSHSKNTHLFDEGRKAFQQGNYEEAYNSIKNYLSSDPNHEDAWKIYAEIEESRGHWYQAATAWLCLSHLNVLNEDYVRKYVKASYRCHYYQGIFTYLENCESKWRDEFKEIYTWAAFKLTPDNENTVALVKELPANSPFARLINVIKNRGPSEEITKLESEDDIEVQVEAYIIDASIAEYQNKDLARAEHCLEKAASLNPFICQGEYADFLFRNRRYKEAFDAYSRDDNVFLSLSNLINYAEAAYAMNDSSALEKIGKILQTSYPRRIHELAYVHALKAHLDGNIERMKANSLVANLPRNTPMAMRLKFAVALANKDIKLLSQAMKYLATSPSFKDNRQQILQQIAPILQANNTDDSLSTSSEIAELFIDLEPANLLVWKIVLLNNWRKNTLSPDALNKALELFPSDPTFRQLALVQAMKKDPSSAGQAFDQWIAVSNNPSFVRFRKASFLQQNGKNEEAEAEILKMAQSDASLISSKLCLFYGIRNGSRAAIEQAAKKEELKPIASFEIERRFGDKDKAEKMLHETRLEDAFTAKQEEDRPIMLSLAVYLAIIHEVDRSIAVYEQLKPFATADATVELNLSELYASKKEKTQAMENAKSALRRFPDSRLVRTIYGLRCAENANFTEAVSYIPDTVKDERLNNALVYCLEQLIEDNFERGHIFVVRGHIERLRKLRPDSPVIEEYTKKIAEKESESAK